MQQQATVQKVTMAQQGQSCLNWFKVTGDWRNGT